jgi:protoporphyrinogen oxidase
VREVSDGLIYRDLITVGLLCTRLRTGAEDKENGPPIRDNWIYVQEADVHLGRIQIFNNWSPWLVKNPDNTWLGLEFFATEGDALWQTPDEDFIQMAINELRALGFITPEDVLDSTILRVKKAYPAYFGSYPRMQVVKDYLNSIPNLYPVGRNGMHRYNNMDHSMLSAMKAVACINDPALDKKLIWEINEEQEYHESK